MLTGFNPKNNYVVIHHKHNPISTHNGILMFEKVKHNDVMKGEVVALDQNLTTLAVKDTVYFLEVNVKSRFKYDGVEYITIKEEDILAKEED
jgi:co-chaperonin GroES (HSP10)